MSKSKWEIRDEKIEEKLSKETKRIADELVKEFELSEYAAYGAIADNANNFKYDDKLFQVSEPLKILERKIKKLKSINSLVYDEINYLKTCIKILKTEELKATKILENMVWRIIPPNNLFYNRIHLEIDKESFDKYDKELKYYFGDFDKRVRLIMFADDREIDYYYNRDDSLLQITINLDSITVDEYLLAFKELGIKINFDNIEKFTKENKEKLAKYEDLMVKFKRD